jgi:hypothetical protein
MSSRAKLQLAYELAFFPPALNKFWQEQKKDFTDLSEESAELLDMALQLHQALPSSGYASQRALKRVAIYQVNARAYGIVNFLKGIRENFNRNSPIENTIPGWMIRDIGLPKFSRRLPAQ